MQYHLLLVCALDLYSVVMVAVNTAQVTLSDLEIISICLRDVMTSIIASLGTITVESELRTADVTWSDVKEQAQDRVKWRPLVRALCTSGVP